MSYKLTPEAENDLVEIYLYGFQNFGEAQAENYFSQLEEVFRMLGENAADLPRTPGILSACPDSSSWLSPHCLRDSYRSDFDRSGPSPQYGCPAAFVRRMRGVSLQFYWVVKTVQKFGSFRIYGSGLTVLRCVSEIHPGGFPVNKRPQMNTSHLFPPLLCQRDILCCRVSPRQARPFCSGKRPQNH